MIDKATQKKVNEAALIMVEVRYLWQKGNNFAQSCKALDDLDSKVVLSSPALELLVKAYIGAVICEDRPNETEETIHGEIDKIFRKIGHDFVALFEEAPDLKSRLRIEKIERVNHTGFIDEYRIKLHNQEFPLLFKTVEASRYGSFSQHKDVLTLAGRKKEEDFLDNLTEIVSEKIAGVFKQLRT